MRAFALMMLLGIVAACNRSTTVTISIPDIDTSTMTSAQIVDYIGNAIGKGLQAGLRTSEVEQAVDRFLKMHSIEGYFRGYNRYPYAVSVSLNQEALGGPPSGRVLKPGDLVTFETGIKKSGQCAYFGWTFPVGAPSKERMDLLMAAQRALDDGCKAVNVNVGTLPVTEAIDRALRQSGFAPSRDFVGFGIGEKPHMLPRIPGSLDSNIASSRFELDTTVVVLVLAHAGNPAVQVLPDGFTIVARDGKDSVLLSKMVRLTRDEPTILSHPGREYR
jgi:methionyl aminopeptidase